MFPSSVTRLSVKQWRGHFKSLSLILIIQLTSCAQVKYANRVQLQIDLGGEVELNQSLSFRGVNKPCPSRLGKPGIGRLSRQISRASATLAPQALVIDQGAATTLEDNLC